jgi:hypothetical protein
MSVKLIHKPFVLVSSALLLTSCALLNNIQPPPTQIPAQAHTQAAQTIIAQVTQSAPTDMAPPTLTLPPGTFTPTPTSIPAMTATPGPAETQPSLPTPQLTETLAATQPQPTSTLTSDLTAVFQDDFDLGSGWYTNQGKDFGFEYAQGGYRIYVNIRTAPIWSIRQRDYADARLEVDATRTSGPESGYYGLVCRFNQEERNYYALVISPDGTAAIAKSENNEFEFLQQGSAPAGVINSGDATNRVRADCLGDTLSLYANGQQIVQVTDDDFESGWIGLIAGTRDEPDFSALFDNLTVLQP